MNIIKKLAVASLIASTGAVAQEDSIGPRSNLVEAEKFVDAFYSFDANRLKEVLLSAAQSAPKILFYQGWAEGGHYSIVRRQPCKVVTEGEVSCSITVEDDLIKALGFTFHVTDTFHLSISSGVIRGVSTTSDDPPEYRIAEAWVKAERAELYRDACSGYFAGGPTPQKCAQTVVQGFKEFTATHIKRESE